MILFDYLNLTNNYRLKNCTETRIDNENMYLLEYEGYGHQQWFSYWLYDKKYPDIKFEAIDLGSTLELNKHAMELASNSVRMVADSNDQMLVRLFNYFIYPVTD